MVYETYKCPQLAIMDSIYEPNEEDLRITAKQYSKEYEKPLVEVYTASHAFLSYFQISCFGCLALVSNCVIFLRI